MEWVDFNKTTFYKNISISDGKVPIILELSFAFSDDYKELKMEFYIGLDKMYKIGDIAQFLDAIERSQEIYFGKNFIFEPSKMCFSPLNKKLIEFIKELRSRRELKNINNDNFFLLKRANEVSLDEDEMERFFNRFWKDLELISLSKHSITLKTKEELEILSSIDKNGDFLNLTFDYSKIGNFIPLTLNYKYILITDKSIVIKTPENKRELLMNINNYKNKDNKVCFKVNKNETQFLKRNFYDRYKDVFNISLTPTTESDFMKNKLISRLFFDISTKGIVCKAEFDYDNNKINPLNTEELSLITRDTSSERNILQHLENYGFKANKLLYYLSDNEKIVALLIDQMTELKKLSEVYYSQDFKKLHVKTPTNVNFNLDTEESVIYMNINLEGVEDDELADLIDAIKNRKKYYRLKNGSIINLSKLDSESFAELLNNLDININSIKNGNIKIPLNKCLYIDNYLKQKNIENITLDEKLGTLVNSILDPKDSQINLSSELNNILRDYQLTGVRWLKSLSSFGMGGILADDMGLGKTLQVLSFLYSEKKNGNISIVIAPKSLIYNWYTECEKFTKDLKSVVVVGSPKYREKLLRNFKDYDLLITSYGLLKSDIELYKDIDFSHVFVDEAQNIKNPFTLNANSVKQLNSKSYFGLTGTPIENRLAELWSIFDFVMPGYLQDLTSFKNQFETPILVSSNSEKANELTRLTKPFMLRRLKKDVLQELPEKMEINTILEMTDAQKKIYVAYFKEFKDLISKNEDEFADKCNNIDILTLLTRLRQICSHPRTFIEDYLDDSCKVDMALEIIKKAMDSGESVLLFSQFTKLLKIMEEEVKKEEISYHYLDGSMSAEERSMVIDNFNSDRASVFLISLKAGGTGLNLTKANIVIHFEPWWNPAIENQASDRAYRLGQKNNVSVYKLIAKGTIEEKIINMQQRKQDITQSFVLPGETFLNKLSEEEIRSLFGNI